MKYQNKTFSQTCRPDPETSGVSAQQFSDNWDRTFHRSTPEICQACGVAADPAYNFWGDILCEACAPIGAENCKPVRRKNGV